MPSRYAEQLIDGVARDLAHSRYQTFDELASYCYGVASTVGLMSMHIIGFAGNEAIPYAIKLGVALQMTNILRDVGEDWRTGRVYLPQAELAEYGLSEADLAAGEVTDRWRAFMQFQIARNRRLYVESLPGVGLLHKEGRFAICAAAELYQGILDAIERADYDVFSHRAYVGKWGKLRMLPRIWWHSRTHGSGRGLVARSVRRRWPAAASTMHLHSAVQSPQANAPALRIMRPWNQRGNHKSSRASAPNRHPNSQSAS